METQKTYSPISDIRLKEMVGLAVKDDKKLGIENIQLEFRFSNQWFTWDELSDGTRRILSIIYYVNLSSDIVLLEEPELGVHPHQLNKLLEFLQEQSREKQIILSTHSPDALDVLNAKQFDNINLVSNKKGSTVVKKLSTKQKQKAQDYLEETGSIGDYWKYSDLEV